MAHLLNWWYSHHHIKGRKNTIICSSCLIVLFIISQFIATSKYNGQVKTLFSSLSLCAEIVILFVPPCWIHGTQKTILSDSLPCLICYHYARCYTYTHSAFWVFWSYGTSHGCVSCHIRPPIVSTMQSSCMVCLLCPVIDNKGTAYILVFPCGSCR